MLYKTDGDTATISAAATPTGASDPRCLPNASDARNTLPIMHARVADGDIPESKPYSQTASSGTIRCR